MASFMEAHEGSKAWPPTSQIIKHRTQFLGHVALVCIHCRRMIQPPWIRNHYAYLSTTTPRHRVLAVTGSLGRCRVHLSAITDLEARSESPRTPLSLAIRHRVPPDRRTSLLLVAGWRQRPHHVFARVRVELFESLVRKNDWRIRVPFSPHRRCATRPSWPQHLVLPATSPIYGNDWRGHASVLSQIATGLGILDCLRLHTLRTRDRLIRFISISSLSTRRQRPCQSDTSHHRVSGARPSAHVDFHPQRYRAPSSSTARHQQNTLHPSPAKYIPVSIHPRLPTRHDLRERHLILGLDSLMGINQPRGFPLTDARQLPKFQFSYRAANEPPQ
jgi:hypothetical protein